MDDDEDKAVDVQAFIDRMTLTGVIIEPAGESTLTYTTWGMPLVVVTVSSDLSFKNALLD